MPPMKTTGSIERPVGTIYQGRGRPRLTDSRRLPQARIIHQTAKPVVVPSPRKQALVTHRAITVGKQMIMAIKNGKMELKPVVTKLFSRGDLDALKEALTSNGVLKNQKQVRQELLEFKRSPTFPDHEKDLNMQLYKERMHMAANNIGLPLFATLSFDQFKGILPDFDVVSADVNKFCLVPKRPPFPIDFQAWLRYQKTKQNFQSKDEEEEKKPIENNNKFEDVLSFSDESTPIFNPQSSLSQDELSEYTDAPVKKAIGTIRKTNH